MRILFALCPWAALSCFPALLLAQTDPDTSKTVLLNEAVALGLRPGAAFEHSGTVLKTEDLEKRENGRDLPFALEQTASAVVTSDAGNGVGYTGLRLRGIDQTRINVTINGIALNDAESQNVFWVNTPDLISGLRSARVQRGLGSGTNGPAAFGASLNLSSLGSSDTAFGAYRLSGGSFSTLGHRLRAATGRLKSGLAVEVGLSQMSSEGYVDRGFSKLLGYQLKADLPSSAGLFQVIFFGGREQTGQAWYGLDSATYATSPRFNFAGAIYDSLGGIERFYDNEIDNYGQDHVQLHWSKGFGRGWKLSGALYQTLGRGYFEQYIQAGDALTHGLDSSIGSTDLVRRLWLDNRLLGGLFQAEQSDLKGRWLFGMNASVYQGLHYGELQWAREAGSGEVRDRFYQNESRKSEWSAMLRREQKLSDSWGLSLEFQLRSLSYSAAGTDLGPVDVDIDDRLIFANPKAALSYRSAIGQFWILSYGMAGREGNRADYLASTESPAPERLHDFEFEHRRSSERWDFSAGIYWMEYRDQLALTGEIDNVGGFVRRNIGSSYRSGLELEALWKLSASWEWAANAALAVHRNRGYKEAGASGSIDYGNSPLAYSPWGVAGSVLSYDREHWTLAWSIKAVSDQFLDNTGLERVRLEAYVLNDLRFEYRIEFAGFSWAAGLDLLNIADLRYASNGYVFDRTAYFYPQAGRNALFRLSVEW